MDHTALGVCSLRNVLLLSLAACACAGWGRSPAPKFAVVPSAIRSAGQGQVEALAGEAANETFLDRLLGTNCFTRALKELDADCRSMGQDQKSRLALALVNCQQATHGGAAYPCPRSRPLKDCVEALPDRGWSLYVEFLTHADSMCIFIQNQNFERYTEGMLGKLAEGGAYARGQLEALGASAAAAAARAAEQQLALGREAVELGQRLRSEAAAAFTSLDAKQALALEGQDETLRRQAELAAGQGEALAALAAGRAAVEGAFGAMEARAAALAAAQREHEATQRGVTAELRSLASDSRGLRSAVDVVLAYTQRSDAVLVQLLGQSYCLEDLLYYGAGAALALAAGAFRATAAARLPALALLAGSAAAERLLLRHLHLFLEVGPGGEVLLNLPLPWWLPFGGPLLSVSYKWAVRRGAAALAAALVLWAALAHKNFEQETYRLLTRMEGEQRRRDEEYRLMMQQHNLAVIAQMRAAASGTAPAPSTAGERAGKARRAAGDGPPQLEKNLLAWDGAVLQQALQQARSQGAAADDGDAYYAPEEARRVPPPQLAAPRQRTKASSQQQEGSGHLPAVAQPETPHRRASLEPAQREGVKAAKPSRGKAGKAAPSASQPEKEKRRRGGAGGEEEEGGKRRRLPR